MRKKQILIITLIIFASIIHSLDRSHKGNQTALFLDLFDQINWIPEPQPSPIYLSQLSQPSPATTSFVPGEVLISIKPRNSECPSTQSLEDRFKSQFSYLKISLISNMNLGICRYQIKVSRGEELKTKLFLALLDKVNTISIESINLPPTSEPQISNFTSISDISPPISASTPFVPGELLINIKPSNGECPSPQFQSLKFKLISSANLGICFYKVKVTIGDELKVKSQLQSQLKDAIVEENIIMEFTALPNDPAFVSNLLWGIENIGQEIMGVKGSIKADVSASDAWNFRQDTGKVTIGILDSGLDINHQDIAANIWTNPKEVPKNNIDDDENGFIDDLYGWDFIRNDNDPNDDYGHGTHVAGIIGAVGNNNLGVVGVAWKTKIIPLKVGDTKNPPNVGAVLPAIYYAIKMKLPIINLSFATGGYSRMLFNAFKEANESGMLIVASTNNKNKDDDRSPNYPSSFNLPNIITVMASNNQDVKKLSSNFGKKNVDLAAPGDNIFSTVPSYQCTFCSSDGYTYIGGASMAAPYVTGALALGLATLTNPKFDHLQVKQKLLESVDHIPALANMNVTGGRLNIRRFLEKLEEPVIITKNIYAELGKPIIFNASEFTSDQQGDEIVSYTWDFGDNALTNNSIVSQTYKENGSFAAKLTVRDSKGYISTAKIPISVGGKSVFKRFLDFLNLFYEKI